MPVEYLAQPWQYYALVDPFIGRRKTPRACIEQTNPKQPSALAMFEHSMCQRSPEGKHQMTRLDSR
jgi:hypothetical protein